MVIVVGTRVIVSMVVVMVVAVGMAVGDSGRESSGRSGIGPYSLLRVQIRTLNLGELSRLASVPSCFIWRCVRGPRVFVGCSVRLL